MPTAIHPASDIQVKTGVSIFWRFEAFTGSRPMTYAFDKAPDNARLEPFAGENV
jgi:hypothetical protein